MKKHFKITLLILMAIVLACQVSLLIFAFHKVKAMAEENEIRGNVKIKGFVFASSTGSPTATITWDLKRQGEYGYKIVKGYQGKEEDAAYLEPKEEGFDFNNGGFYTDGAVELNQTYTYKITAFDRDGNEFDVGQIDLKIVPGEGTK